MGVYKEDDLGLPNGTKLTHVVDFSFIDDALGIPTFFGRRNLEERAYVMTWFVVQVLALGMCKVLFRRIAPNVVHAFMMLLGWSFGQIASKWLATSWIVRAESEAMIYTTLPILFFVSTFRVDYHTLLNNIGLILLVSIPILVFHYVLVILIAFTLLKEKFRWSFTVITTLAVTVGVIQVDNCVQELNRVQGQMRVLQLLLVGERFASFAFGAIIQDTVQRFYNPNMPPKDASVVKIIFMSNILLGLVVPVLLSQIYRWVIKFFYKDIISQATLTLACIYMLLWVVTILEGNGMIAVLSFGISVGYSKIKYSSQAERFFDLFWSWMYHICVGILMGTIGFYLGVKPHSVLPEMAGFVFLIYVLIILARALGFATAYPLIGRFGYQLSIKHLVIATIGVNRSTLCIAFAYLNRVYPHGYYLVQFSAIVLLASTFFNVVLLPKYLTFLEMYKMSRSRIVNMNVALTQVNECREKCIRSLKMDRLIADSNWGIVDKITRLPHPYADIVDASERTDDTMKGIKSSRTMDCHSCGAENEIPPTRVEFEDMLVEAKQRILKAQLVSFWKQYDNGTLTRQGVSILNNLIESAAVKEDPKLSFKDLKIQREGTKCLRRLKSMFGHLFTVTSETHRFIPTNVIRAFCFRLCTLRSYRLSMAVLCLADIIIVCFLLNHRYSGNNAPKELNDYSKFYQICDFTFFSIFVLDFLINILGIGVVQYFLIHVNKVEFATCLIRANEISMYLHTCAVHNQMYNVFLVSETIFIQKATMLVRICRIYFFIVALIPKIMVLIDQKLDDELKKTYDIGKAYLISLNRVMYFLNHIADNETVYSQLLADVETDRMMVTRELGLIQKERPTIAITNKTLHAIRHVIICMGDCISSMKDEGLLDPSENKSLVTSLEKVKRRLLKFRLVEPTAPDRILFDQPWLCNDFETCEFFLRHARLTTYLEGEKIIYYHDDVLGLFVLVSGMVRCDYVHSDPVMYMATTHGQIPNCDYFTKLIFDVDQTELIVAGNLIGEMGVVTGRRYEMEVTCETRVQVYRIPWKVMKVAMQKTENAPLIKAKIWKTIGIRIAIHLLHNTARFQGWQDYKILLYLQRGIVPVLDEVEAIHVSEFIDDIILIEGKLMDSASRTVFYAPCCIPRIASQKLLLPGTPLWETKVPCQPRLLVIPNAEAEMEDVMSNEGLYKYSYQDSNFKLNASEECGEKAQHMNQSYISRLVGA